MLDKQLCPISEIELILASTSVYRRDLLSRISPRFRPIAPNVDEIALPHELPHALAVRLAQSKASALASNYLEALIIGSDQVAVCEGKVLTKPGNVVNAMQQLQHCSGKTVNFYTAVCLIDTRFPLPRIYEALDITHVVFRQLLDQEISLYLKHEQPFDCAGSFKAEKLGIALFERIETNDPTALIGLPLIALCRLLREAGISIL